VVIAIVGVLAGILIPVVGKARFSAKRAMCLSNIKGMLSAIHAYAVDHNGSIPYGPIAPPPSPSNLYPVTGMVTSQLSLRAGEPVGLGLLLTNYLGRQPAIVFCPGTDQRRDARAELAKVGTRQAVSGYYYRHGGNTLATLRQPHDTWDDHTILESLGRNRRNQPIRALITDQNFLTGVPLAAFGIVNRTNHKRKWVHAGYADGHAEPRRNNRGRYTVDVGNFPFNGPSKILAVFERLDVAHK